MVKSDEDSLICDFAETYHIYDNKRLPVKMVAALAVGLRDDSRIKMKLSGAKVTTEIMLLAAAVDRLSFLTWAKTKDAEKGRNRPKSILDAINAKEKDTISFTSGEEFEKEWKRLTNQ